MQMNVIEPQAMESHDVSSSENVATSAYPDLGNAETSQGDASGDAATTQEASPETSVEQTIEMLGKLPPEIGMLLVISGIAGILLPGPVGTPLLIAGGVTMWPKTFQPIERWFSRRFPKVHQEGVFQIKEFVASLQRRFPENK